MRNFLLIIGLVEDHLRAAFGLLDKAIRAKVGNQTSVDPQTRLRATVEYAQNRPQRVIRTYAISGAGGVILLLLVAFVLFYRMGSRFSVPDLAGPAAVTPEESTEGEVPPKGTSAAGVSAGGPAQEPITSSLGGTLTRVPESLSDENETRKLSETKEVKPTTPDGPEQKRQPPVETVRVEDAPGPPAIPEVKLPKRPVPQSPAEPGNYETTRFAYVRGQPDNSAGIIDELTPGIKFEVIGSEGDWLVVRSKRRKAVVYIRKDDAMFVSPKRPAGESYQKAEARWKKVEVEIAAAIGARGINGVKVSLIGDTAFLKGEVKTNYDKFLAEQVAKSFLEVQHVHNGISVRS